MIYANVHNDQWQALREYVNGIQADKQIIIPVVVDKIEARRITTINKDIVVRHLAQVTAEATIGVVGHHGTVVVTIMVGNPVVSGRPTQLMINGQNAAITGQAVILVTGSDRHNHQHIGNMTTDKAILASCGAHNMY